jgi:molecular chaperone GrpE (heat shock protein)
MTEPSQLNGANVDDLAAALFRLSEGQEQLRHDLQEGDLAAALSGLGEGQRLLRDDFERLAGAVAPLLTKQYRDREQRIRALETVIRNRQERPVIQQMAKLLADVRRLDCAEDIKAHVEESVTDTLTSLGYQEMGSEGEPFDPGRHEPMAGSVGRAGIVTRVHSRGLACHGDVIIKARVEVEPAADPETEQGGVLIWEP